MRANKPTIVLTLVFLAIALILAPSLNAAIASDWASLKQLTPGERVKVSLTAGTSVQGELQSLTDDALVVHSSRGDQTFARETILRVSVKSAGHRGRHALIGAAIGAGAGLGMGAAIDADCGPNSIVCTGNKGKAISTPLFGLLGAGIGALLPAGGWREVYRSH